MSHNYRIFHNKIIQFSSLPVIDEPSVKLTYAQKLDIAHMMGLGYTDPCIIPSLELLNKARNQVAHKLNFDISVINELIRINSEDYHENTVLENANRLRRVRYFTVGFCAYVSGTIVAHAHLDKLGHTGNERNDDFGWPFWLKPLNILCRRRSKTCQPKGGPYFDPHFDWPGNTPQREVTRPPGARRDRR